VTEPAGRSDLSPIPPLRLSDPALLFEERAARLAALAVDNATGEHLGFLARLARGQARAVREVHPAARLVSGGPAPLAAAKASREGAWRRMLGIVLAEASAADLPGEARLAIKRLEDTGVSHLEAIADEVLAGAVRGDRPDALAAAPFVGAALQAFLAALAAGLDPAAIPRAAAACPVCGGPPVASIVRGDDRVRYVVCGHCSAQRHLERVHCTLCGGNVGVAYFTVEGEPGARAEACERCKAYVKVFDLEKRAGAEPLADDAATLALDLLMADDGWGRGGVNLLFAAGADPAA